jgi:hypothetical protein
MLLLPHVRNTPATQYHDFSRHFARLNRLDTSGTTDYSLWNKVGESGETNQ